MVARENVRSALLVTGGFFCYLFADGCTFSVGLLYSNFLTAFNQSSAATAFLPGLMYGVPQLCSPFVCPLVETTGSAFVAALGGVLLAFSFFVSRFVASLEVLYVTLGVFASLGLEMTYVSGIMAVTKGFSDKKLLGLALGVTVSGSGIGIFVFNPLLSYLIDQYSWKGAMTIESAIFLNLIVAGGIFKLATGIYQLPNEQKPKIEIKVIQDRKNYHSIVRHQSQSHSAEALDVIRESYTNGSNKLNADHQLPHIDHDQRSSTFLAKTQTKHCEPFYKPINAQHKSSSLDRRVSTGDNFPVKLPVDERAASFVRRLSLYSSQNIKGSSQNIRTTESHKVSQESILTQPSLLIDTTEDTSQINDSHILSSYEIHLINARNQTRVSKFKTFFKSLKDSLLLIVSRELWTNKCLLLFYFSTFLFAMSVIVVWTFSYNHSINIGLSDTRASFLVSIVGIGSCVGQIFFGYISDIVPAISLYGIGCVIAGLVTIILRYITTYWLLAFLHGLFGFGQGVCYALFSVILVHYGSVDMYHASLAIYLIFSGSGNLIGTTFAGYISDVTGGYGVAYSLGGTVLALCGVCVIPLVFVWHRSL